MTTYHYEPGAVRWRRCQDMDPRGYRCAKGWEAFAEILDFHPITGRALKSGQWWIKETFTGDEE